MTPKSQPDRQTKPVALNDEALGRLAGGTRVTTWDKVQELRPGK